MLMHVDLDIHQDLISHNLKVRLRAKAVAQQHVQVAIAALYMCMGNYASVWKSLVSVRIVAVSLR